MKINFIPQCVTPESVIREQLKHSDGKPRIEQCNLHRRRLAVVGGGPSALAHLSEIARFDDVWGINYVAMWLNKQGIPATFVTIDCQPFDMSRVGGHAAILPTSCHPDLHGAFDAVRYFDTIETHDNGLCGGTTTATRIPHLATTLGYCDVTFYGCEGSYLAQNHIDEHRAYEDEIIVRAGKDYKTTPEFLLQAQNLGEILRNFPEMFREKSGGLLSAMVSGLDWEIVAVSGALKDKLEKHNGTVVYDVPYQEAA